MTFTHTVIGHYPSHTEAEKMVIDLQKQGFDLCKTLDHWQRLSDSRACTWIFVMERYCQRCMQ